MICLLFNSRFYSKIAQIDHHSSIEGNRINTVVLYGNMALFSALLRWIPLIGYAVAFFVDCIIMAYYCFEYKWMREDWPNRKRLSFAEEHWSYYLGFGLPGTLLTFYLSTLKAGAVFALIYPSFIIMALTARPKPIQHINNDRIPVFFGVKFMNQCASVLLKKIKY
ncbi:etoposide-induced protein 2.4-domain-containing protein [Sporodiniella umbellata]|nr:etoposide-induced protein 2.4-domain-containing protein [Sporodiniella umbellata]